MGDTEAMEAVAVMAGTVPLQETRNVAGTRTMPNTGNLAGRATTIETRDATRRERFMLNLKVVTWSLALFGAVSFVVCILYGLIVPEPLHMTAFLEAVLPGFKWLTPVGFLVGLVEAFLYGAYVGIVYVPINNWLTRRWTT